MAYTIKKTDGTILLNLADGKVDQLTTSISLLGKNVEPYGQYYNNNLVGVLENFASVEQPRAPLHGQLWFNKLDNRMYVYGLDNTFKPVAGAQISSTAPTLFSKGDLWIDPTNKQLWFSADGTTFTLAGPQYSSKLGKSGWIIETVQDNTGTDHTVASLYSNDTLMGIVSANSFSFGSLYQGMLAVSPGFNLNPSIPGVKFVGTATSADSVNGYTPSLYLKRNTNETTTGTITILNNAGIGVGTSQDITVSANATASIISSNVGNKTFKIRATNTTTGHFTALSVDAQSKRVGILTETPQVELDVNGSAFINGNLTVNGASTISLLRSSGNTVELGYGNVLGDAAIINGGIVLHGTTPHSITWGSNSWNISQDSLNLSSIFASYKINGNSVLTSTSLGQTVTSAPGITEVGHLTSLNVSDIAISGSVISAANTATTIFLSASPTGSIDVVNSRITSLKTPVDSSDAATKGYVDSAVSVAGSRGATLTIDITGMTNVNAEILSYLNKLLPVVNDPVESEYDLPDGMRVRVLCVNTSIVTPANTPLTINASTTTVDKAGVQNAVSVVTSVAGVLNVPAYSPVVTRSVKEFKILNRAWNFVKDVI